MLILCYKNGCLGPTLMTQVTAHHQPATHFSPHCTYPASTASFILSVLTVSHRHFHDCKCTISLTISRGGEGRGELLSYYMHDIYGQLTAPPHSQRPPDPLRFILQSFPVHILSQHWPLPCVTTCTCCHTQYSHDVQAVSTSRAETVVFASVFPGSSPVPAIH